ncbi:MAG: o-succinylbenzoate synthase [Bacteroidota bacterium]
MKASFHRYILDFKRPSGTSRGVMIQKETWFLVVEENGKKGIGECGILRGLSFDDRPDYKEKLKWVCENINLGTTTLHQSLGKYPSIQFGLEQALLSLLSKSPFQLFPSDFVDAGRPIAINGLVWMGDKDYMFGQIKQKLKSGFSCIKLKIGAIDFKSEMDLLAYIRGQFSKDDIEIRVDANGAFDPESALDKLKVLADLDIHSIEQPVKQGQWQEMAYLCKNSPIPIALDEELIGIIDVTKRQKLLQTIQPQYIILKPSLVGGFKESEQWINLAEKDKMGWWITSALESNIGLNALAQWTFTLNNKLPQGLGTGSLFTNNFDSPLDVQGGNLFYRKHLPWQNNLMDTICI